MLAQPLGRHDAREKRKAAQARESYQLKRGRGVKLCGAKRKYDGKPCEAKALPNGRCKYHGGMSTGAKTPEGKARALAALARGQARRQKRCSTD